MTDEYRDLLDTETILPGDQYQGVGGDWYTVTGFAYLTPRETVVGAFRRPIPAKPAQRPKPAIDPGEGWRLLKQGDVIEDGDEYYSDGDCEWMLTGAAGSRVTDRTYRRHVSRTVDPIHRAYIHRHPSPDEDVLPSMRFAIVCPDGVRRHAATWDEAVAVFDDAVRRECERKGGQS